MNYPILEFDPTHEAFIEPSKVIRPRDVPELCVICFFKEVIDRVVAEHNAVVLVENRWEDGPHPLYEDRHTTKARRMLRHAGMASLSSHQHAHGPPHDRLQPPIIRLAKIRANSRIQLLG
jgi:hypothetical protein